MKKILAVLSAFVLLAGSFILNAPTANADASDLTDIVDSIIEARIAESNAADVQDLVTNYFAANPTPTDIWYILALRNYTDEINYAMYRAALLEYIGSEHSSTATENEKDALVYISVNGNPEDVAGAVDGNAGKQGLMSWVCALHLLNNGAFSSLYTANDVVDIILSLQLEAGGWAIIGSAPDVDTTAMTVQALAPYYDENEAVKAAVDTALDFLSSIQNDTGAYASFGTLNSESTAQVLLALSSLGIDAAKDERFIKSGNSILDGLLAFRLPDGTFSHTAGNVYNKTATVQALYCLTGYCRYLNGLSPLYSFDTLTEPETDTALSLRRSSGNFAAGLKLYLYIGIAVLLVLRVVLLLIKKKKSLKKYLTAVIVAVIAAGCVYFINIQSAGSYYGQSTGVSGKYVTTTISITCETVAGEKDYIPDNGVILEFASIKIPQGASAYDQLIAAAKQYKIQVDGASDYISGIGYIYEYDFGDLSGWMYRVNGEFASVGCGEKTLNDNDYVEWIYTRNLGQDIGDSFMAN